MSTAEHPVVSPKKLIEVALPLDAINDGAAHEKKVKQGLPANLHLWWARRPLAAARAVIFSQLVNDPEDLWWHQNPGAVPNKQVRGHWTKTRQRLFKIIEELVLWENTTNEELLERAREEIRKSWREVCELNRNHPQAAVLFNAEKMPGLHDPFAGGGAIPLEAQRLGLEAYASDLNPVAVLINKAMIEIPPKFAGRPPVHPGVRKDKKLFAKEWKGAEGLAEDVRQYGQWMRDEAEKRIGQHYPKVEITAEMAKQRPDLKPLVGQKLLVIAWIWARTVQSPNPAFSHVDVPLAGTFVLASKAGKEAYVHPIVERSGYSFTVMKGKPPVAAKNGTKSGRGTFQCLMSGVPIDGRYLRQEGKAGRMGHRLMAIVAEGERGRVYLSPTSDHESIAAKCSASWKPDVEFFQEALGFRVGNYGMTKWSDLFTSRQLLSLSTFSELIGSVRERVRLDAETSGDLAAINAAASDGTSARAYADAVAMYLAFVLDKAADLGNSLCGWEPIAQCPRHLFGKQSISMIWDFAEGNFFGDSSGSWNVFLDGFCKAFAKSFRLPAGVSPGKATQSDAQTQQISRSLFVSTDPPYYDNIGYADLSDFFYVWWFFRDFSGRVAAA